MLWTFWFDFYRVFKYKSIQNIEQFLQNSISRQFSPSQSSPKNKYTQKNSLAKIEALVSLSVAGLIFSQVTRFHHFINHRLTPREPSCVNIPAALALSKLKRPPKLAFTPLPSIWHCERHLTEQARIRTRGGLRLLNWQLSRGSSMNLNTWIKNIFNVFFLTSIF